VTRVEIDVHTKLAPEQVRPGSYVAARTCPAAAGGSDIHLVWDRTPISFKGRFVAFFMKATRGKRVGSYVRKSLDKLPTRATGPPARSSLRSPVPADRGRSPEH